MTTLRIALAQSPHRAATAQTAHGSIEVRALMTDQPGDQPGGQRTWTGAWRYELLTATGPAWTGSYGQIVEAASYLRHNGAELDWQPVWERATPPSTTLRAKGMQ